MVRRDIFYVALIAGLVLFAWSAMPTLGLAADAASAGGGYLSGYENTDPKPSQMSWWSTLAYLISLFAVFAFVIVMAYFASKFLSGKFGKNMNGSDGMILEHLPLGPNRSVCVVELAGHVLMLGVTEHQITLLGEINDEGEIERLHRNAVTGQPFDDSFTNQMGLIGQFAKRVPSLFKDMNRK